MSNPGSETARTSPSRPSNCSRCWAATPSSSWPRVSIFRSINWRRFWRNNCQTRWTTPALTASSRIPPEFAWIAVPQRAGSIPRGRRIPPYRAEIPASFAHLPCPDVTGQKARRCAIQPPVFQSTGASGTVGTADVLLRMERALKHKFTVGETVYFTASNVARPAASGTYEVIRLLPTDGDDCQYRIKSSTEAFERVAKESQLDIS